MRGKPTRGMRRIQMLHDLANNGGFVALRQLRTERDGDTERGCQNLLYSRRLLMMMMYDKLTNNPTP